MEPIFLDTQVSLAPTYMQVDKVADMLKTKCLKPEMF